MAIGIELNRVAIDTSKQLFTPHDVDGRERLVLRCEQREAQVGAFLMKLPPTEVVLEACAGLHYWGKLLIGLSHRVRLIRPQYVNPFVKRGKNDRSDAEGTNEAASRPTMRSVPMKTARQQARSY